MARIASKTTREYFPFYASPPRRMEEGPSGGREGSEGEKVGKSNFLGGKSLTRPLPPSLLFPPPQPPGGGRRACKNKMHPKLDLDEKNAGKEGGWESVEERIRAQSV